MSEKFESQKEPMSKERFKELENLYFEYGKKYGDDSTKMDDAMVAEGMGISLEEFNEWEKQYDAQPEHIDLKERLKELKD